MQLEYRMLFEGSKPMDRKKKKKKKVACVHIVPTKAKINYECMHVRLGYFSSSSSSSSSLLYKIMGAVFILGNE